ncbi:hypothetical protein [Stenotrophomonas maltophilia]|nr:hypothetical protein [Stenotrophomonas maltophilia]
MELAPGLSRPIQEKISLPPTVQVPALREGLDAGAARHRHVRALDIW